MTHEELMRQIVIAKLRRKETAIAVPYLFPEYMEYVHAKENYKAAKKNMKEKRKIWKGIIDGK